MSAICAKTDQPEAIAHTHTNTSGDSALLTWALFFQIVDIVLSICRTLAHNEHMGTNHTTSSINAIAASMTPAGQQFLIALCGVTGNNVATAEELAYYRSDLYTWFDPSDLLPQYSAEQIGGHLSNLHSLGMVCGTGKDGRGRTECSMTLLGVEVAIAVLGGQAQEVAA